MRMEIIPYHPACCALALLLLAVGASAAASGDWPAQGNDQGHSGFAATLLLPGGQPLATWSRVVGMNYGDTPWPLVVGGGTIFTTITGGDRATLLALDAATGAQRWRSDLLFQQAGGEPEPTSLSSTPVYANGRVYCCVLQQWTWSYQVLCLDAASGATLWRSTELYPQGRGTPAAPVVTADGVYLNLGWDGGVASMYRVGLADGTLLAELFTGTESITPPAMAGGRLVTWYDANLGGLPGQSGYGLAEVDPSTLVVRGFTRICESLSYLEAGMVLGDGLAFVGDPETATVTAVDLATRTRLWSYAANPSSRLSYAAGVLHIVTPQAILALDARTGMLRHTYRCDTTGVGHITSQAIITPDSLIASGSATWIWTLGSELPRAVLSARGYNAVLAGVTLVVQNSVHPVNGYGLPLSVYHFAEAANRPPVATSQSARTLSDDPVRIVLQVTDAEGDALTVRVIGAPTHGILGAAATTMIYTPAPGFSGTDRFTYRVNDGHSDSAIATVTVTVTARGAFIENAGQVVIEAEHAHRRQAGRGVALNSSWARTSDPVGASAGVALRASPNSGVNTGTGTDGPRLDYDIQFGAPGTWHVWLRLQGASGADDSVLVGLDGVPVRLDPTGLRAPGRDWRWSAAGADLRRFTVCVASPGIYTLNVWMREDGVAVDKLLLTTTSALVPSGVGPPESRFLPAGNRAPLAVIRSDVIAGRAPFRVTFDSTGSRDPEGTVISVRWLLGDGSLAIGPAVTRTYTRPGLYRPTVIVTDAAGVIGIAITTVVVLPPAGALQENDGRIVLEAEDSDLQTAGSGAAAAARWLPSWAFPGFAGVAAVQATENAGVNTRDVTSGPRLDYVLQVDHPGTYAVWVRLAGATGDDDSVHIGIDGRLVSAGGRGISPAGLGTWQWSDRVSGGAALRVVIPTAGRHVLNVWMREDGVAVDRLVLSLDQVWRPAGVGPAVSLRLPLGNG